MLTDAAMTVALTQDKLRDSLPTENLTCFCLDSQWEQVSGRPTTNPTSEVTAANLAYIIYTSGSTGKPKGVLIDHRGAVNTILDINRRFRVRAADRVLAVCSLNFDLSVYDVFGLLAAGGTIVLPQPAPNPRPSGLGRNDAAAAGNPVEHSPSRHANDGRICGQPPPAVSGIVAPGDDER
jgi:non-ribosomal peptide synthetase component F